MGDTEVNVTKSVSREEILLKFQLKIETILEEGFILKY
jgi:hypothetical protein